MWASWWCPGAWCSPTSCRITGSRRCVRPGTPTRPPGVVGRLATRVRRHLAGAATAYTDIQLDLDWCTEFQRELALALRAVPWGEIVSYGELAALAGRPGAARAAGTFCAQNRFALLLPCHRVVSSERHRRLRRLGCRAQAQAPRTGGRRAVSDPTATLAEDVRAELAAIAPERACDRLAELSALFHAAGRLHLRGRGEVALHLDLASSAVARRAFALLRSLEIDSEIRTYRRRSFEQATRYELHVAGAARTLSVLAEAGVLDRAHRPLARPPRRLVSSSCCRGAYLRGAFLAGGSLVGPPSPHLELRVATREGAEFLREHRPARGRHTGRRRTGPACACVRKGVGDDRDGARGRRCDRCRDRARGAGDRGHREE